MIRVPNQPKTPHHSFRCPDELWEAGKEKASQVGNLSLSEVLRAFLRFYVDERVRGVDLVIEKYVDSLEREAADLDGAMPPD